MIHLLLILLSDECTHPNSNGVVVVAMIILTELSFAPVRCSTVVVGGGEEKTLKPPPNFG